MFELKMYTISESRSEVLYSASPACNMIVGTKPSVLLKLVYRALLYPHLRGSSDSCEAELRQKIIIDAIKV